MELLNTLIFRRALLILLLCAIAPALDAAGLYGVNLVVNGGGEAAAGATATNLSVFTPAWNIPFGGFTGLIYFPGAAQHFPTDPGISIAPFGGANILYGGPVPDSYADQEIDLSSISADVSCGSVSYVLDGWLGGWLDHPDLASLRSPF